MLLRLPVHAGGARIKYLHAIAAHVSLSRLRILCNHHGPGDVTSAVLRPALQNGKIEQRKVFRAHHLLTLAAAHSFGKHVAQLGEFRQHFHFVEQPLRRLHVQNRGNAPGNFIERLHFQRQIHSPLAADQVRHRRDSRAARPLKKKRRAARLHRAVRYFGDFQHGIHFGRNPAELALLCPAFSESPGDRDTPLPLPIQGQPLCFRIEEFLRAHSNMDLRSLGDPNED